MRGEGNALADSRPWDDAAASSLIASLAGLPGAMLPILHALQDEFGYIDAAAIPLVAEALNASKAEVVGVVNFYHDFRQEPPGRHTLAICRAEACQSMGGEKLVDYLSAKLRAVREPTARGARSTATSPATTFRSSWTLSIFYARTSSSPAP